MFKRYFRSTKKSGSSQNDRLTRSRSTSTEGRRRVWNRSVKHSRSTTVPSNNDLNVGCLRSTEILVSPSSAKERALNMSGAEDESKYQNSKNINESQSSLMESLIPSKEEQGWLMSQGRKPTEEKHSIDFVSNCTINREGPTQKEIADEVRERSSCDDIDELKLSLAMTDEETSIKLSNTTSSKNEDRINCKFPTQSKTDRGCGETNATGRRKLDDDQDQGPTSFGSGANHLLDTLTKKSRESGSLSTPDWSEVRSILRKGLDEIETLRARLQEVQLREGNAATEESALEPNLSFYEESNSGTSRSDRSETNDTTLKQKQRETSEQTGLTDEEESSNTVVYNKKDPGLLLDDTENSYGQVLPNYTEIVEDEVKDGDDELKNSDEEDVGHVWGFHEKDQSRVESDEEVHGVDDLDTFYDENATLQLRIEELEEQLRESQAKLVERTKKHEQELLDKNNENRRNLIKVKRKQLQALANLRDELTETHATVYAENISLNRQLAARKVREEELQEQILKLEADFSKEAEEALRLTTELQETREKMKKLANQQKVVVRDKRLEKEVRELRICRRDLLRQLNEKNGEEKEQLRKTQEYSLECARLEDAVSDLRQQLSVWRARRTSVPEVMIRRATLDTDTNKSASVSRKRRCKTAMDNIMLPMFIKKLNHQDDYLSIGDFVSGAKPEEPVQIISSSSLKQCVVNSPHSISLLVNSDNFSSSTSEENFVTNYEAGPEQCNTSQRRSVFVTSTDGKCEEKSHKHESNQVSPDPFLYSCELSSREQSTEVATVDEYSNSPSIISTNVDSKQERVLEDRNLEMHSSLQIASGGKEDSRSNYRVEDIIPLVI